MTDDATAEGPESGPAHPVDPNMPEYKGAPLDAERGPGLGCFWIQVVLLIALLVLTPLSVVWAWSSTVSAALLILSLVLLFFVGQTMIFLLRLVAADRRSRRRPMAPTARPTVGDLEDAAATRFGGPDLLSVVRAVARGERPWQDLRDHGVVIHEAPPFDDIHVPPEMSISRADVITGLRANAARDADMRMWAFVVLATAHFATDDDNEQDERVTALLGDLSAGQANASEVAERLGDL